MLRRFTWMALLAGALCGGRAALAQPAGVVDVSVFYEPLAQHGEWVSVPPYGWVWAPYDVAPDWRPYQLGHWVATESGWTWVSDEPFGWATYHYGRWHYHPFQGWVWIPGTQWGPAWVAWRRGEGWVGWAPMPPEDDRDHIGIHVGKFSLDISRVKRFSWCFVEERSFCEPRLTPFIARQPRNVNIVNITQNVTNYTVVNNTVINRSISVETIEKRYGRPVPRYTIVDSPSLNARSVTVYKGPVVTLYRPKITIATTPRSPVVVVRPPPPTKVQVVDLTRQFESDRRALDARLAVDRRALEDRQRHEMSRPQPGVKMDDLHKRHAAERAALDEQVQRERKLLERSQERVKKGEVGPTTSTGRKYKIGTTTPPPGPTPPPPQPKKKR